MEKNIRANELIAIELVKAWCSQPNADFVRKFGFVMENYKTALQELDKMDAVKKDTKSNELTSSFNYSLSNDE